MTEDQLKAIEQRLEAFKYWKMLGDPADYEDSHGPDMEALIAEVKNLTKALKSLLNPDKICYYHGIKGCTACIG